MGVGRAPNQTVPALRPRSVSRPLSASPMQYAAATFDGAGHCRNTETHSAGQQRLPFVSEAPPYMPARAQDWNVVLIGAWNRAILTPDGIRKRLLQLPDGTPVHIEVALDRPGSFRIKHDGLVVTPGSSRLEVSLERNDFASLERASAIGQVALRALPETPVAAAGVNVRYTLTPLSNELIDLLRTPIDDVFSDAGFQIETSTTGRALALPPGVINVEFTKGSDGDGAVSINFHYESTSTQDLSGWLSRVAEFRDTTQRLLEIVAVTVEQEA